MAKHVVPTSEQTTVTAWNVVAPGGGTVLRGMLVVTPTGQEAIPSCQRTTRTTRHIIFFGLKRKTYGMYILGHIYIYTYLFYIYIYICYIIYYIIYYYIYICYIYMLYYILYIYICYTYMLYIYMLYIYICYIYINIYIFIHV